MLQETNGISRDRTLTHTVSTSAADSLPQDVQDLVSDYNARYEQMTPKERTKLEKAIWDNTPAVVRKPYAIPGKSAKADPHIRGRFLAAIIGRGCPSDYKLGFTVFSGGPVSEPLWERIEKGLPMRTAARLLGDARKAADKDSKPLDAALADILYEYDQRGTAIMANGKVIRRRTPYSVSSGRRGRAARNEKTAATDIDPEGKGFWAKIRSQLVAHIRGRFEGLDPLTADRLAAEVDRNFKAVADEAIAKVVRVHRQLNEDTKLQKGISVGRVRAACHTLSMDPPAGGVVTDKALKQAKSQKKKLVRLYHPDAHQGSETTRPQYEAVLEAYLLLEEAHNYTKDQSK